MPAHSRGRFLAAALGAAIAFAVFGLLTSLAPSFLAGTLHQPSHLLAGAVSFAAFATAALAQTLTGSRSAHWLLAAAIPTLLAFAACWSSGSSPLRPRCSAAASPIRFTPTTNLHLRGATMQETALNTTRLGDTGLEITRVGFGAWAIGGGGWEFGWGPQDDEQSIAAIHHALEHGINWIDTAAAYGFGRSEQIVGRALEGLAERPYVFTKCSLLEGPDRRVVHSLKRDSILREAEASLARLGVDAIDLYQIHWPIPVLDIEEGWAALAELKEQGLVRHIGVSNFDVEQLRRSGRSRRSRRSSPSIR